MADKKGVLTMTGDVTAAQAALYQRASRGGPITRAAQRLRSSVRKRRSAASRPRRKSASGKSRAGGSKGRLKKGSPAAKRRMAALRRMQKR